MPAAVTAAVSYIGSTLLSGTVAGAFLIMNATAVATVTLLAGTLAVGDYQRRKARRAAANAYNASLQDRFVMQALANGARKRVYGRVRTTEGVLFKGSHGADKEFYTMVVGLAGHEIDAVEDIYFGDTKLTLDGDGWVTDEPWGMSREVDQAIYITLDSFGNYTLTPVGVVVDGSVVADQPATESVEGRSLPYTLSVSPPTIYITGGTPLASVSVTYKTREYQKKARVREFLGAPGQDLSPYLIDAFPDLIDSGTHRFEGLACLLVELEYATDAFPQGLPNVTATIRGAKVSDPRGSPAAAWTRNPALIARDWALYEYGGGVSTADIDEDSFLAAINACEVETEFNTTEGTQSMPLYTCDIVCSTEDSPWGTFEEIVESMAGKAGWSGGLLRVVAGVYRGDGAWDINEDWVHDKTPIEVIPELPSDELVNVYRSTISNSQRAYMVDSSVPEVRDSAAITADGREYVREVTLGGVTDPVHAQHVCGVLMRDARAALTVKLPCNYRAIPVKLFDSVFLTLERYGWSAKEFEVVKREFSMQGGVVLTLKETDASIYTPDTLFEQPTYTAATADPILGWHVFYGWTGGDWAAGGTKANPANSGWAGFNQFAITPTGHIVWPGEELDAGYSQVTQYIKKIKVRTTPLTPPSAGDAAGDILSTQTLPGTKQLFDDYDYTYVARPQYYMHALGSSEVVMNEGCVSDDDLSIIRVPFTGTPNVDKSSPLVSNGTTEGSIYGSLYAGGGLWVSGISTPTGSPSVDEWVLRKYVNGVVTVDLRLPTIFDAEQVAPAPIALDSGTIIMLGGIGGPSSVIRVNTATGARSVFSCAWSIAPRGYHAGRILAVYPGTGYLINASTGGTDYSWALSLPTGSNLRAVAQSGSHAWFVARDNDNLFLSCRSMIDGSELHPWTAVVGAEGIYPRYDGACARIYNGAIFMMAFDANDSQGIASIPLPAV